MKTNFILLIGAVTLTFLTPSMLADSLSDTDQSPRDPDVNASRPITRLGDLRRANEIIGADIKDDRGANVGRVKDLGLDLQNGRIVEVIVATRGNSATEEKLTAVPPQSFVCEGAPMILRLKADRAQLANAPAIQFSHWNEATRNTQLMAVYTRFGTEPYFTHDTEVTGTKEIQRGQDTRYYSFPNKRELSAVGYVARASKLIGTVAWNIQGEKIAHVNNFVVDLPSGRVVEVILARGGFWGMRRQLSAVPPQAFRLSRDNSVLGLDTTQEALDSAPHFKASNWNSAYRPERVADVYALYSINPYFIKGDMNADAQNVRTRTENGPSAIEQSNTADMDTTTQIRKAIAANAKVAADADGLKIVTSDGKVTITGTVRNADEKRQVGEAAAKVVSAEKVDNQIDVSATPASIAPAETP